MSREYDAEILKAVQNIELEILESFLEICEKHHLTYFALAGTGIGALRHQGFIPWDDDIDVGLPRADYEKFLHFRSDSFKTRVSALNCCNTC